jgi:uncharacterized protein (DUF934 family)
MPPPLLRDGRLVEDDYRTTADADVAEDGPLILTFAEWQAARDRWLARRGPLGVVLSPSDEVEKLAPDLGRLTLAGADFPNVSEGRGYTQGRLLRERFGFRGELRARGSIRRDHVFLLARCGFNSFELPEAELAGALAALSTFSAAYQPSNDAGLPHHPQHRGPAPLDRRA